MIQYFVWTVETDLQSLLTDAALRGEVHSVDLNAELSQRLKNVEERGIRYPDAVEKLTGAIWKFRRQLVRAIGGLNGDDQRSSS